MIQPKRYTRSNTTITISLFYEQYQMDKYNFNPSYQREGGIWKEKNQAFLIDTIFKNFPMPPVFLEQKIKNGITTYDVIDGKQRLTSIISFINNEISLPKNFSDDEYGYKPLNGKKLNEIIAIAENDKIAEMFLDIFWSYKISVEYIEKPDTNIVKGIFDRLNRNGERLNSAELRKAKFSDAYIFKAIEEITHSSDAKSIFLNNTDKRQRASNFWTEVIIFVDENKICAGSANFIENKLNEFLHYENEHVDILKQEVKMVIELVLQWKIDLVKYDIAKETHLYVLLYLANYMLQNNIIIKNFDTRLNEFYENLRAKHFENKDLLAYYDSTQSGSKSVKARTDRFNALKSALNI